MIPPPRAGWRRRALRIAAWNLLIAIAGLALAAGGAEVYLRLAQRTDPPFTRVERHIAFVPGVGLLVRPGAEVRYSNHREFWTVSRANGLGFVDREPIDPRRAAESCHIAAIGDSFVQALEVPIADKFHVRLEDLAARALPGLDVTTSAWGSAGTGTINQLPFYDVYARRMEPKILILVFFENDFRDNAPLHLAYQTGRDPDRHPFVTAVQAENGTMTLRPPSADGAVKIPPLAKSLPMPPQPWLTRTVRRARRDSFLAKYVWSQWRHVLPRRLPPADYWSRQRELWIEVLRQRPDYAWVLPPRGSAEEKEWVNPARWAPMPPRRSPRMRKYISDFTAFGIDRFKERADRDGATLLIFFVPELDPVHEWGLEALSAMARERGVPLIDLHDYIARQGRDVRESRWKHDFHWNATGHLWAAEALLEWLAHNRHACGAGGGRAVDETPARG